MRACTPIRITFPANKFEARIRQVRVVRHEPPNVVCRNRRSSSDRAANHFWDHYASMFSFLRDTADFRAMDRQIVGGLRLTVESRCLELGCGSGQLARALAGTGAAVTALESSEQMLLWARQLPMPPSVRIEFVHDQGDYLRNLPDFSMDCVMASLFLHYVENPQEWLAQASRLLKPGGQLAITIYRPTRYLPYFAKSYARLLWEFLRFIWKPATWEPNISNLADFHRLLWLWCNRTFRFLKLNSLRRNLENLGFSPASIRVETTLANRALLVFASKSPSEI